MKGEQSHIGIRLIRVSLSRACWFFMAQKADKYVPLGQSGMLFKSLPLHFGISSWFGVNKQVTASHGENKWAESTYLNF